MSKLTIFQKLSKVFSGNYTTNDYTINLKSDDYTAKDKAEYDHKKEELRQQHLLARQWKKASYDITNDSLANLNNIKMMYRDADIMDDFPEIGTALDIVMEECTCMNDSGFMINIMSKSERIKSVLQDLFVNRLMINTQLPMICRAMCKYGNTFMLLNIDRKNGVTGWKMLPVYEVERYENGMDNPYAEAYVNLNNVTEKNDLSTKFVWIGESTYIPYYNWQIAHFRLLYNSLYLPYGISYLNKARRHFRMLSIMEDMMLIYRLERSIERRVFKINVGAIDEADVPAYVQQIADNFKRTPVIDPLTGQLDLRKNLMSTSSDFFIPVRTENASNPIETLPAAQNLTAMDDIKFIQNKVLTALRVPKPFLNFEETEGDGKNLSLLDVRFSKTINRIQQSLIMELNKVAIIHLMLLGFSDELTNFSISMNNPSSQAEMLELENLAKKITTAKDAVGNTDAGIPVMSLTKAWKTILKWSDDEIFDNLEKIRIEKALGAELEKTSEIIKRTGIFDSVDNIYGEPDAEYSENSKETGDNISNGGMGGGMSLGGGDIDFGDETNSDNGMDVEQGAEGEMSMGDATDMENNIDAENGDNKMGNDSEGTEAQTVNQESIGDNRMKNMLTEIRKRQKDINRDIKNKEKHYMGTLRKKIREKSNDDVIDGNNTALFDKTFIINEELNELYNEISKFIRE